jgi:hypothetical protein
MKFLWDAVEHFEVHVLSSRSHQWGGRRAMKRWVREHFLTYWSTHRTEAEDKLATIRFPLFKPPAAVTLDDRAITFTGTWPALDQLRSFRPWNK